MTEETLFKAQNLNSEIKNLENSIYIVDNEKTKFADLHGCVCGRSEEISIIESKIKKYALKLIKSKKEELEQEFSKLK